MIKNIAIFASGKGTNAENIIKYFSNNQDKGNVSIVISNNANAEVINRAKNHNIKTCLFTNDIFRNNPKQIIDVLESNKVDLIVLAGFMIRIHQDIVDKYSMRIINIHPSLLPKYGGKGMYGIHVHEAVINSKEKKSGITIHYVDNVIDGGTTIFQAECEVSKNDTPESLENKIHQLEYKYYPQIISELLKK